MDKEQRDGPLAGERRIGTGPLRPRRLGQVGRIGPLIRGRSPRIRASPPATAGRGALKGRG